MTKNSLIKNLFFFLVYITLSSLLVYYFYVDKNNRLQIYLAQKINQLYAEFRATKNTYAKLSSLAYDEITKNPQFVVWLENYPQYKKQIDTYIAPHFSLLKKYSIAHLSIYDPAGNVIVSMHKRAKKTKKSIFERDEQNSELIIKFKRPIYANNRLIALFESAVSYNTIKQELQRLFGAAYAYIVKDSVIDKRLIHYGSYLFIQSDLHKRFFYEEQSHKSTNSKQKWLIHQINSLIKNKAAPLLDKQQSFATIAKIGENYYVVSFLAIKVNDALSYLISYKKDTNIKTFDTIFWQNVILSNIVLLIALLFIYYFIHIKQKFETLAITDKLTGLYNRNKFYKTAQQEINRATRHQRPLSLIIFDIDNFKKINDTYGHDVGDYVLKTIAKLVHKNIRKYDYAFRWGGEEFIILSPETSAKEAMKLAEKIRNLIAQYRFDKVGKVTISLGVAEFDKESDKHIDAVIKRADSALYLSKKDGKNRTTLAV
ncbi:GGDEF domain-containing protein [Nitratiruptor sp. YY09-18]|uniref:GGDEF domain-containing protein n=1 Tax=Nitratiruptor sp. YY09-18 TaxID=2724901 RepID=UPI00191697B1|nr:GGDEF domain-containing protein [Nitratiruptor sp. YY09-18]BCD68374.1 diguanylate cyclase [Nitratiruptor sp. YY09-18]